MSKEMRKSYFICDAGSVYYLGQDNEIRKETVANLLSMYSTNRAAFEEYINDIQNGSVGLCSPDEYIFIDAEERDGRKFKHMPTSLFKKLINDPDTIRLRHRNSDVILLQYSPRLALI